MRFEDLEHADTHRILEWVYGTFGEDRVAISTAFGPSGVVLMHLASQVCPGAKVFFVDTGFHFAETLEMIQRVQARLNVNVEAIQPKLTVAEQAARHGEGLYLVNPDACCAIRKVEPTQRMLDGLDAWLTALRRDQGPSRANTPVLDRKIHDGRPLAKVAPMVRWTKQDIWGHVFDHDLPYNALHDQGYPSVGCWPCTRPVAAGGDERDGRWAGQGKTECGLHTLI